MVPHPESSQMTAGAPGASLPRSWRGGIVAVVLAAALYPTSHTVADPDLWGHVLFGQELLARQSLPVTDHYAYTSDGHPWINHELISEVLFGWTYTQFGSTGLIVLKTLVVMLTLGLVYGHALRSHVDLVPASMLMLLTTILVLPDAIMVRPHIFTYLFFAITILILYKADQGRSRLLWLLPPLFAIWINTHGGVLAGVAMLVVWSVVQLIWRAKVCGGPMSLFCWKTTNILLVVAAATGALLLNPYGVHLVEFLVRTGTVPRPEITEWNPVKIATFEGLSYVVFLVLMLVALIGSRRPRQPAIVALLACTALLPLLAQRHLPLFALTFAILGVEHVAGAWERMVSSTQGGAGNTRPWMACVPWLAAAAVAAGSLTHFKAIKVDTARFPMPVRAVGLLNESRVSGHLAVLFDWGEYVIWHLGPNVRVSVDGRRETVYSPEAYQQNLDFMYGTGQWDALLTRDGSNLALVSQRGACVNLMKQKPDWELIYQDRLCALFARRNTPQWTCLKGSTPPLMPELGEGLDFPVSYAGHPTTRLAVSQ